MSYVRSDRVYQYLVVRSVVRTVRPCVSINSSQKIQKKEATSELTFLVVVVRGDMMVENNLVDTIKILALLLVYHFHMRLLDQVDVELLD